MWEKTSDEVLMAKYLDGDVRAFEQLLERHRRGVFAFILRFTHSKDTAQELLQDVFLKVVDKAHTFQQRSKFTTWLYSITRNLCIDHLRRMRHRKTSSLDQPLAAGENQGMTLLDKISSDQPAPDRSAHANRLAELITKAVGDLSPEQREVFVLREQAGLAFDEIATVVDAPLNTVKSRMRYALQNLRSNLQSMGIEP
jgi:RNA polymerase sigma-70 factor (ECF subfamily)